MKTPKTILLALLLASSTLIYAQTNTFPTSGNVGIGTTSPSHKMTISSSPSSSTAQMNIYNPENAPGAVAGIRFQTGSGWNVMLRTKQNESWLELTDGLGGLKHRWNGGDYYAIGKVGIGTESPRERLDVRGNLVLDAGTSPVLFTGTGPSELDRYLQIITSPGYRSASGLMVGGLLVSDNYTYASPDKNDLVVKGKVGIGKTDPQSQLDVAGFIESDYLRVRSTSSSEGGEIRLDGATDTNEWHLDNFSGNFRLHHSNQEYFRVSPTGNVGIGTADPGSYRLAVNGSVRAKEVVVETGWSDFVFEPDYDLPTLAEVEAHIAQKGHLQDIPSAAEVAEKGISLGAMDAKLLQKIEELMLYTLAQQKEIMSLKKENQQLRGLHSTVQQMQQQMQQQMERITQGNR